jgi:hypothetical protein
MQVQSDYISKPFLFRHEYYRSRYLWVYLQAPKSIPGSAGIFSHGSPRSMDPLTRRYSHGYTCRLPVGTCTRGQPYLQALVIAWLWVESLGPQILTRAVSVRLLHQ